MVFEVDESIHFEKHKFIIDVSPFRIKYLNNELEICDINSLGLLSIERTRKTNQQFDTDSTTYAAEDADLFMEKDWKDIKDPIPNGP